MPISAAKALGKVNRPGCPDEYGKPIPEVAGHWSFHPVEILWKSRNQALWSFATRAGIHHITAENSGSSQESSGCGSMRRVHLPNGIKLSVSPTGSMKCIRIDAVEDDSSVQLKRVEFGAHVV